MSPETVHVECYAGYRGDETPRRFHVAGGEVEVAEIVGQWQEPDRRCFRIRDRAGGRHVLCHDTTRGHWELTTPRSREGAQGV